MTALGAVATADSLDLMLDLISDRSPAVRGAARRALARIDPDTFLATLSGPGYGSRLDGQGGGGRGAGDAPAGASAGSAAAAAPGSGPPRRVGCADRARRLEGPWGRGGADRAAEGRRFRHARRCGKRTCGTEGRGRGSARSSRRIVPRSATAPTSRAAPFWRRWHSSIRRRRGRCSRRRCAIATGRCACGPRHCCRRRDGGGGHGRRRFDPPSVGSCPTQSGRGWSVRPFSPHAYIETDSRASSRSSWPFWTRR